MIQLSAVPSNMQTGFLRETVSDNAPEIRRERNKLIFPAFVRLDESGEEPAYRYFNVPVPFTGQDMTDYGKCARQSHAALRKHFYGDFAVQNEQMLKGTFAAHQYAVRSAFPKSDGETIAAVERFNAIKSAFWNTVDAACASADMSRDDLPERFNAEDMIAFAAANGMTKTKITEYSQAFSAISMDMLHNGRNWSELFG